MMTITTPQLSYEQLVQFARQLPLAERVRLIRDILAEPAEESEPEAQNRTRSMLGICSDLGVSLTQEQIDEARREMWGKFYG